MNSIPSGTADDTGTTADNACGQPLNWNRATALGTFVVASLGRSIISILLQHVSLRYGWTPAQVGKVFLEIALVVLGWFLFLKSSTSMLLLPILLRVATYLSDQRSVPVKMTDLHVARSNLAYWPLGVRP